jgi:hypothetical protein
MALRGAIGVASATPDWWFGVASHPLYFLFFLTFLYFGFDLNLFKNNNKIIWSGVAEATPYIFCF